MNNRTKVFKYLIVAVILLLGGMCLTQAQQKDARPQIGFAVYQDVNLALWEDDNGLTPFTPNPTIKMRWSGIARDDYGQFVINTFFTYAELSPTWKGKYYRYGVEAGYTFSYMHFFHLFNYEFTPLMGAGFTHREFIDTDGMLSISLASEISFRLWDELRFNVLASLVNRPDLPDSAASGNNPLKWKPNVAVGIEYRFNVYQPTKTAGN